MPSTQYYTASSLDGFIADTDNSLGWLLQFSDGSGAGYERFIAEVGAIAMGSTTYEWVLANHVFADPDAPAAWPYRQPSWVFSSRPQRPVPGAGIRFVTGPVAPVHADMAAAAGGKNIWLVGGGDLVGQFHDAGLLHEVIVTIAPVTLGAGAPLLPRRIAEPPLRLASVERDGEFATLHFRVPA